MDCCDICWSFCRLILAELAVTNRYVASGSLITLDIWKKSYKENQWITLDIRFIAQIVVTEVTFMCRLYPHFLCGYSRHIKWKNAENKINYYLPAFPVVVNGDTPQAVIRYTCLHMFATAILDVFRGYCGSFFLRTIPLHSFMLLHIFLYLSDP
jgi:hypothetical protein